MRVHTLSSDSITHQELRRPTIAALSQVFGLLLPSVMSRDVYTTVELLRTAYRFSNVQVSSFTLSTRSLTTMEEVACLPPCS